MSTFLEPQVFKWMDCLLKSVIGIHNGCLMSVFKEEMYYMDGLLIEVIEFLLKIFLKKYNRHTFQKNSGKILPEVL